MKKYEELIYYYKKCFGLIDCFHFNSMTSSNVYRLHTHINKGIVVPITHCGINDNRKKKSFDNTVLRIGFIGREDRFKGLPLLISVLKSLNTNTKWNLNVWGGRVAKSSTMPIYYNGKFGGSSIRQVYDSMDLLIVPSIWKETFSLVTLEALSYGVPVIVSDNVGAQDIVNE